MAVGLSVTDVGRSSLGFPSRQKVLRRKRSGHLFVHMTWSSLAVALLLDFARNVDGVPSHMLQPLLCLFDRRHV